MEELKTFVNSLAKVIDVIGERLVANHEAIITLTKVIEQQDKVILGMWDRIRELERKANNEM
jgi:hypothetical protein